MAQISFTMNYMDGLDIKAVIHNLEMVGYAYYDAKLIYNGLRAHHFYNDVFAIHIYSDKEGVVNSISVRKFSIEGDKDSKQEEICITNKLSKDIFPIGDVPIEGVLEILYTTPNDEIIEELRKLSVEKILEPLNG